MCFLYDNELGEVMYELGQNDYAYFVDLLWDLSRRGIGAAKVQPLIKIDYFEQFGNSKKLLRLSEMYYELFKAGEAKSIKKDKVANSPTMQQILSQYGNGNKKDGTPAASWKILDMKSTLHGCEDLLRGMDVPDFDTRLKIQAQNDILGYFMPTGKEEDRPKLFVQEVPEIYEGVIKIKSVARAPGSHAKIAVETQDPSIDAVGMTVGIKGTRIQPVINECHGEKIDVILYSDDPAVFIVNAMQPAKVAKIIVDEDTRTAAVVVNEDQQSLAIGRRGQNVRLASQLTGWNIDVMNEAEEQERRAKEVKEKTELFIRGLDVDEMLAHLLITEGFRSIEEIAFVDIGELESIQGFNAELATELQNRARAYLEKQEQEYKDAGHKLGMSDDLLNFDFIKRPVIMQLGNAGIKSLNDLADLATDELIEIVGEDTMSPRLAGRVIMKARELAYGITQGEE